MSDYVTVRRTGEEVTALECPRCNSTSLALIEEIIEWRPLSVENGQIYIGEDDYAEGESKGFRCLACETELNLTHDDAVSVYSLLTYL